jgi:5-aminolevulinate synthase
MCNRSTIQQCRPVERLGITQSPHHTDANIEHLVQALAEIWAEVGFAKAT